MTSKAFLTVILKARMFLIALELFCLMWNGCCRNCFDGDALFWDTMVMTGLQMEWTKAGRPEHLTTSSITPLPKGSSYFVYTNAIKKGKDVYHCTIAATNSLWPQGKLVATQEGPYLWIRDRDELVTVHPEQKQIER